MIVNVIGIRCERCGVITTYDQNDEAIEVLNKAERYGWEWHDDKSVCPRCAKELNA